ncbi:glutaredoxin family protein [uncultured Aquabacterium sp.]|uniref:glutaredoxin family protein n=1 Tax=uncultured Aquabacterium sp. TaxID=158753 RepID=UPI00261E1131|nr:glutaredoxin family protein [uncultured Aquabacterium sp.]
MSRKTVLPLPSALLVGAIALMGWQPAWALYKVVGPDGKVTYTDRPPPNQPAQALKADGSPAATERLPYALQQVVGRYPVVLYTGRNCAPCDAGRQMLKARGVPFIEKTVTSADDAKALQRAENTDGLPVLRVGAKQLQGYAHSEWVSYLDAAGYPAQSALPATYQWPAPQPLVAPAPAAGEASGVSGGGPRSAPATEPAAPAPAGTNGGRGGSAPPGFRF